MRNLKGERNEQTSQGHTLVSGTSRIRFLAAEIVHHNHHAAISIERTTKFKDKAAGLEVLNSGRVPA